MLAPVLYFPSAEYDEAGKERRGMKTRGKMGMPNIYKAALLSLAVWVLICGGGALLLLVLLNFLFVDSGMANFLVTALVVFGGAAAAFLVQVKPKKRQTFKIKKR